MVGQKKRQYCFTPLEKHLRSEIMSGGILPGKRLSPESALQKRFRLSRASVRKALAHLKEEGLLLSTRGKGTFVAPVESRRKPAVRTAGAEAGIVLLLFPSPLNRIYRNPKTINPILSGIGKILEGRGIRFSMRVVDEAQQETDILPEGTKGILFLETPENKSYRALLEKYPSVGLHTCEQNLNCNYVYSDNFRSSFLAVEHLMKLGHRRIGYFTIFSERPQAHKKYLGYLDAMHRLGLPVDPAWLHVSHRPDLQESPVELTDFSEEVTRIMTSPKPPTAIICQSNYHVRALAKVFRAHNWSIPEDISLFGCVNETAQNTEDGLSCISSRSEECCYQAARLLADIVSGKTADTGLSLLIHPVLLPGSTTAPPRKTDKKWS